MSAEPARTGVVGLGLIGGSLALRLTAQGHPVLGTDPDPSTRAAAVGAGLAVEDGLGPWLAACDLVAVCAPLDVLSEILHRVAGLTDDRTTVIDVGSVKAPVHRLARDAGLGGRFVGVHPMAGTERSGFQHASADLFDHATWAVTLEEGVTDATRAATVVRFLAERLDARVCVLTPALHDEAAAVVSHVPHVVAHLLLDGAEEFADPRVAALLAAGSFRDGTRVAGTNPARTRNMLAENHEAVGRELARLRQRLDRLATAVERGDRTELLTLLEGVAHRAGSVRHADADLLASDEVDAEAVLRLLGEPGSGVVVSPRRRG